MKKGERKTHVKKNAVFSQEGRSGKTSKKKFPESEELEICHAGNLRGHGKDVETFLEQEKQRKKLSRVGHRFVVLSGKGGVGKSVVATNLAVKLSLEGMKVGLLDIDINGTSVPKLLGLSDMKMEVRPDDTLIPVEYSRNLKVVSAGLMFGGHDPSTFLRGEKRSDLLNRFVRCVEWGTLDYLFIDSPPGTADEVAEVLAGIEKLTGAIIVTTPQEVSVASVRKCIEFCRQISLKIFGIIENMSGFCCPNCGKPVAIFMENGGVALSNVMGLPFLGKIPIDPALSEGSDSGRPVVEFGSNSISARAFFAIAEPMLNLPPADFEEAIS